MSNYEVFKEVLVVLYYLAGIGLFSGIVIALRQLKVMKDDIRIKNKRASVNKSIEYLNWFATEFIPESDEYYGKLIGKKINLYDKLKQYDFNYNEEVNQKSKTVMDSIKIKKECGAGNLNNQLEFFSAAMMSGLADEELAFNPLAEAFCEYVEINYDVYCDSRKGGRDRLFSHTIALYKMWHERLESIGLSKEKQKIEEKMSKMTGQRVKILGN